MNKIVLKGQKGRNGSSFRISALPRGAGFVPETGLAGGSWLGAERNRPFSATRLAERSCHVWTAPCWQGISDLFLHRWSELPCVRPTYAAVHIAAGHNALRRTGPGQKHALKWRHGTKWVVPVFGPTGMGALFDQCPFQPGDAVSRVFLIRLRSDGL